MSGIASTSEGVTSIYDPAASAAPAAPQEPSYYLFDALEESFSPSECVVFSELTRRCGFPKTHNTTYAEVGALRRKTDDTAECIYFRDSEDDNSNGLTGIAILRQEEEYQHKKGNSTPVLYTWSKRTDETQGLNANDWVNKTLSRGPFRTRFKLQGSVRSQIGGEIKNRRAGDNPREFPAYRPKQERAARILVHLYRSVISRHMTAPTGTTAPSDPSVQEDSWFRIGPVTEGSAEMAGWGRLRPPSSLEDWDGGSDGTISPS